MAENVVGFLVTGSTSTKATGQCQEVCSARKGGESAWVCEVSFQSSRGVQQKGAKSNIL